MESAWGDGKVWGEGDERFDARAGPGVPLEDEGAAGFAFAGVFPAFVGGCDEARGVRVVLFEPRDEDLAGGGDVLLPSEARDDVRDVVEALPVAVRLRVAVAVGLLEVLIRVHLQSPAQCLRG